MKCWKKYSILLILGAAFIAMLLRFNQFEKTALISTEGQSYEKAVVTEITQDNLAEDGNRYGNQQLIVRMKSGTCKGQELEAVNPSGTLFGADCTVGMNVIVIVSSSDDTTLVTVYSRDRSVAIYGFFVDFRADGSDYGGDGSLADQMEKMTVEDIC